MMYTRGTRSTKLCVKDSGHPSLLLLKESAESLISVLWKYFLQIHQGHPTKIVWHWTFIFLIEGEPCLSIPGEDVPVVRGDQEQELQRRPTALRTYVSFTHNSPLYNTSMTSKLPLQQPIQTLRPPVTCPPGQTLCPILLQCHLPRKIPSASVPWGHHFQTTRWGRASLSLHASLLHLHPCQILAMLPCQELLLGKAPSLTWCLLLQYLILPPHQSYHSKSTTSLCTPRATHSSRSHHLTSIAISTTLAPFRAALPTAVAAAAIFGTRVSIRERSHKMIDGLQRGASTTTSTDIVNTGTSTVTDIGPLPMGIVGIEAGVRIGGGRKAVGTGQITTEEGYRLITEVTSVAGNVRYLPLAGGKLQLLSHSICINVLPSPVFFPVAWEVVGTQVCWKELLFWHLSGTLLLPHLCKLGRFVALVHGDSWKQRRSCLKTEWIAE